MECFTKENLSPAVYLFLFMTQVLGGNGSICGNKGSLLVIHMTKYDDMWCVNEDSLEEEQIQKENITGTACVGSEGHFEITSAWWFSMLT